MYDLVKFIPLLPLIGFVLIGLFGKKMKSEALIGTIASAAVGGAFVISVLIFFQIASDHLEKPYVVDVYNWIAAGDFSVNISYQVDQLSILFSLVVTGVGFLIHVYSIGYMHGDRSFYRFFAYLNLFIFMMLNLVLSSNLLLTFLGWEGVGLCSYLLIGFWYEKEFEGVRIKMTGDAGNKAFIVNRIGDFGFLIAMFLIFTHLQGMLGSFPSLAEKASVSGLLDYRLVNEYSQYFDAGIVTAITLLLFLGCTGKSAQIPLAVWLPDAMAGPTPVSALIHAATMVTAGIFLVARNAALFALAPTTMVVIAVIGIATAFFAASVGLVQNDFKKVLAYSTVSQLGFMFAALGVGAFAVGVFHVMTHAFFKGLLFLGAGAVIHGMHDEQNIKLMGGLKKHMPTTHWTFFVATLAISGIPFFAGFFSKDEILWFTFANGGFLPWLILALAAFFTAFYMMRLTYLVFYGKERFDHKHVHPHEAPATMTIPLIVLAILSALGGFLGVPHALGGEVFPNLIHEWLHPVFADAEQIIKSRNAHGSHPPVALEYVLMIVSVLIALLAFYLARKFYSDEEWKAPRKLANNFKFAYNTLLHKYKLDEFYFATVIDPLVKTSRGFLWKIFDVRVIDGIANGLGTVTRGLGGVLRKIQTGVAQNYALLMVVGILIIISWLIIAV